MPPRGTSIGNAVRREMCPTASIATSTSFITTDVDNRFATRIHARPLKQPFLARSRSTQGFRSPNPAYLCTRNNPWINVRPRCHGSCSVFPNRDAHRNGFRDTRKGSLRCWSSRVSLWHESVLHRQTGCDCDTDGYTFRCSS